MGGNNISRPIAEDCFEIQNQRGTLRKTYISVEEKLQYKGELCPNCSIPVASVKRAHTRMSGGAVNRVLCLCGTMLFIRK